MSTFLNAMKANIDPTLIASKGGLSYLSAATANSLAGLPETSFVDFGDSPFLPLFDGALVAVDIELPEQGEYGFPETQRTFLPVMDGNNRCIPLDRITVNDVNNSRQRCFVKAISTVLGHGMSVFLGLDGDGAEAAKVMGLDADSDLATSNAVISKLSNGGPFLAWTHALAAARIVDPLFTWDVTEWDGKPYREVLGGVLIDIDTVFRGRHQRLSLPMMDEAFNPVPVNRASVWLWNRTVMRALAKAISFHTGYGLNLYAQEFGELETTPTTPTLEESTKDSPTVTSAIEAKSVVESKVEPESTSEPEAITEELLKLQEVVKVTEEKSEELEEASKEDANPEVEETETSMEVKVEEPVKPEDTPASKAKSAPVSNADAETRFRGVMRGRLNSKGVDGLIGLFSAIQKSVRYSEEEKPLCFRLLVSGIASIINEESVFDPINLALELETYKGIDYVPEDSKELVIAKIVQASLARATIVGDEALSQIPELLQKAGVVSDTGNLVAIASENNVPEETIDLLLSLV